MMKKALSMVLAGVMTMSVLAGCGSAGKSDTAAEGGNKAITGMITVVSREEGSGTRGAFVELTGVEQKDASGNKVDNTTAEAVVANKTDVVLTNVAGDPRAIGYVSLGSLNDTVKALKIDGVAPSAATVKDKSYKLSRPFNIATKGESTGATADFIRFILSAEGQKVVSNGYITIDDAAPSYKSDGSKGKVTVGGSSSVSPIMEKLIESYKTANPNVTVDLQTSDSTAGMTGAMDGTFDIGMASRELKDSEKALTPTVIALDGIAVIVNSENAIEGMTMAQVKDIYTGTVSDWSELA